MDIVYKKKSSGPKTNRYAFPTSTDMKEKLDRLKAENKVDVNEMLRLHAEKIIEEFEPKKSA
jgi:hypothetical protein